MSLYPGRATHLGSTIPDAEQYTFSFPVSNLNSGAGGIATPGTVFPRPTWIKVIAEGYVTRIPLYAIGGQASFGPAGKAVFAWGNGIINHAVVLDEIPAGSRVTEYVQLTGAGIVHGVSRDGYPPRNFPGLFGDPPIWCGVMFFHPPCDRYEGTTTFTLVPLISQLKLEADSTKVKPNSVVTFTWGADPVVVEGKTMPVVLDSSHWAPDPAPEGETTSPAIHASGRGACDPQYLPACRRRVTASGTFSLSAWVNGKRYERAVHVTAQSNHTLLVDCGGSVERGQQVTCSARLSPGDAEFTITRRKATHSAGQPAQPFIDEAMHVTVTAGGTYAWSGTTAVRTRVEIEATVPGDTDASKTAAAEFSVTARSWPKYTLNAPVAADSGHREDGRITYPPKLTSQHLPDTGSVGHLHVLPDNFPTFDVDSIAAGPNAGWEYLRTPLTPPPSSFAHLSKAMNPGDPWYERQRKEGRYDRHCSQAQVDTLRARVRAHEGVDPPGLPLAGNYRPISHHQAAKSFFDSRDIARDAESSVARGGLPFQLSTWWWALMTVDYPQAQAVVHLPQNVVPMPGPCQLRP